MKFSNASIHFKDIQDFEVFADEMRTHIDRMDGQLQMYLKHAEQPPDTRALLRSMHSCKGTAGFWGMQALQEAAHRAETCLLEIDKEGQTWSKARTNFLVQTCQELLNFLYPPLQAASSLVDSVVLAKPVLAADLENTPRWHLLLQGIDEADDLQGLQDLLELMPDCVQLLDIRAVGPDQQSWTLMGTLHPDELASMVKMHVAQKTCITIEPISTPVSGPSLATGKGLPKTLRVPVASLSGLQNIAWQLDRLQGGGWGPQAVALVLDLRQCLSDIRLVTVADALERYEPMVQALAQRLEKNIEWHLHGGNTLVDRRLMERVNELLLHLVRNSCDHGIEAQSDRLANGKLAVGNISLSVFRSEAELHFNLSDDGAGLSRQAVLSQALRQGLAVPKNPVDDAQIWPLIFESGFSTASQVTDISGRGVGLDVVRQTVLDLGGQLQVQSKAGEGLTFAITVPDPSGW
jgi:chemotaxis protein histidine kinase CheA